MVMRKTAAGWAAALGALAAVSGAVASPITFSATFGSRAAQATFDTSGSDLVITLHNTSSADVFQPDQILTALFFDVSGPALGLTRTSAVVPPGSTTWFGTTDPGGVVGGEWAYVEQLVGAPLGAAYGISSTGLGLFGPGDVFPGSNLQGPASPGGLEYGLTSTADNTVTGNTPVTGSYALVQDTVVFTLSGLPGGFDPSQAIRNVVWQYGTSLTETRLPEPGSLALLCAAGLLVARRRPRS